MGTCSSERGSSAADLFWGDPFVDQSWVRNTAAGCAIACGAMVVGPGMAGTAVASAHLFGVDIHDLFDHKKKNKKSDRAANVGPQRGAGVKNSGGGGLGGPRASKNSKPESKIGTTKTGTTTNAGVGEAPGTAARAETFAESPQSARVGTTGQAPSAVLSGGTAQAPVAAVTGATAQAPSAVVSGGGGGGGAAGAPTNGNLGRAPGLAPVPTAPSSRTIVIRSAPPKQHGAPAPAIAAPPVAPAPVVVPPAPVISVPVPAAPPVGVPPAVPSAPSIPAPQSEPPAAQPLSVPAVPESFRLGYADYLRMASTSDLLFAVLPGLGGMLLMTAAGGAVGFRQARAAQTLPSPQIARFLP